MLPDDQVASGDRILEKLQSATISSFGFEWQHFADWGWLDKYPDVADAEERFYGGLIAHTQNAFWSKSLFKKEELGSGLTVLDAGCGNGRFAYQAALTGSDVVGIDLGWGVHSAFKHTRAMSNVHIVRGDLLRLPFPAATFDRIFSIGVLMHTGNAAAAFGSIARALRPGGLIVAHVYGRGIPSYERTDACIRAVTTRMPIRVQMAFARLAASTARFLRKGVGRRQRFYGHLYQHITLLPTTHHMFDWWSAPVASHHDREEVIRWFADSGLSVLRTNPPSGDSESERTRCQHHAALTVLGRRDSAGQT